MATYQQVGELLNDIAEIIYRLYNEGAHEGTSHNYLAIWMLDYFHKDVLSYFDSIAPAALWTRYRTPCLPTTLSTDMRVANVNQVLRENNTIEVPQYNIAGNNNYLNAWDYLIGQRLLKMCQTNLPMGNDKKNALSLINSRWWRYRIGRNLRNQNYRLKFGQRRIANDLPGLANRENDEPHLKALNGRQITTVQPNDLAQGLIWPIAIFHNGAGWVAANNRGYAVHCRCNVQPYRLIPRPPSNDEANRLDEPPARNLLRKTDGSGILAVNGQINGQNLDYGTYEALNTILPREIIPITYGPNDLRVVDIIKVPVGF